MAEPQTRFAAARAAIQLHGAVKAAEILSENQRAERAAFGRAIESAYQRGSLLPTDMVRAEAALIPTTIPTTSAADEVPEPDLADRVASIEAELVGVEAHFEEVAARAERLERRLDELQALLADRGRELAESTPDRRTVSAGGL